MFSDAVSYELTRESMADLLTPCYIQKRPFEEAEGQDRLVVGSTLTLAPVSYSDSSD
jgi:hypothetical protein